MTVVSNVHQRSVRKTNSKIQGYAFVANRPKIIIQLRRLKIVNFSERDMFVTCPRRFHSVVNGSESKGLQTNAGRWNVVAASEKNCEKHVSSVYQTEWRSTSTHTSPSIFAMYTCVRGRKKGRERSALSSSKFENVVITKAGGAWGGARGKEVVDEGVLSGETHCVPKRKRVRN